MTNNYTNEMNEKTQEELLQEVQTISSYTGANMKEAYQAYMRCNKDVIQAIIELEEVETPAIYERVMIHSEELFEFLRNVVAKGNVSRVVIKRDDKVLMSLPVTMGALGVVMFPYMSIAALLGLMFGQYEVLIEKNKIQQNTTPYTPETARVKKLKLATVDKM
ncbi:hypothetical protein BHU72_11525 [Desulfuribacillus stibiiarsenatis]|uniref:DUF4342 domain-containing protein n=1 Tax=Desulfuribacillus stibiiarsenatis TaxID=1390249 RepID=A0A1E5L891_9FIRM|nr:DUF4342 domain-containing protein [Desulfuribacillus stibiiarsenatis]OEH86163.1 hypothetical protein BHU72_11525 [Desulfuribacillus stibiiarsenatis]